MTSDLRTFLAEIDDILLRVRRSVDIRHVSALIAQAVQPILFEQLNGFPGWRLCDLFFLNRVTQARVLRTEPKKVLSEVYRRISLPPKKPRVVSDGPVKQRVLKGDEIDLRKLPGFQHAEHDIGRVITAMTLCKDPESGSMNAAFTRVTPRTATHANLLFITPHMKMILAKYEEMNKPMPFACVVGMHPCYEIAASFSLLTHLERFGELELAPNLLGEDIELVSCHTIDLAVPATAELVIEGHVPPNVREDEGPGPSPALYYYPGVTKQPVFDVELIMMREDPIFRQHNTILFTDHQPLPRLTHEAILFERLRELGIEVHDVRFVPWGGALACVIQMAPQYEGQVNDALLHVMGAPWPNTKLVVAVDEDVNMDDPADLFWAISTRVDPQNNVIIVPNARGNPMDPSARPIEGLDRAVVGKWGINATKPPAYCAEDRKRFERCFPPHWGEIKLADYLKPDAGKS